MIELNGCINEDREKIEDFGWWEEKKNVKIYVGIDDRNRLFLILWIKFINEMCIYYGLTVDQH